MRRLSRAVVSKLLWVSFSEQVQHLFLFAHLLHGAEWYGRAAIRCVQGYGSAVEQHEVPRGHACHVARVGDVRAQAWACATCC